MTQADRARALLKLHHAQAPLVLINVWDALSARVIEELGFLALATTSAGVSWVHGFADGEELSRDAMLASVKSIVAVSRVPVTADAEAGYGRNIEDAVATARGVLDAGAVGLNFEDVHGGELLESGLQQQRISAMRMIAGDAGVPLVINARTDVFLNDLGPDDAWRFDEAVRRGNAYLEAGADCIFVPGVVDEPTIDRLVKAIRGPVSMLAGPSNTVTRYKALGVARVSVGSNSVSYAFAQLRNAALSARDTGSFAFSAERIPYADVQALFH